MTLKPFFAAMLAALALAGCGPPKDAKPTCPAGKLCFHLGNQADPTSIDPQVLNTFQADTVVSEMFVGLLTDGPDARPQPAMATRWTTSPDGLVWTFKLRDAVWSDGVPVTADDFVFALRRLQDPNTASEYSYLLYVIKGAQAVVHARVGRRHDHLQAGQRGGDAGGGIEEDRPEPLDLRAAAAGQHGEHRAVLRQLQGVAGGLEVADHREAVGQRMADEACVDAVPGVDRRFHREQPQHAVGAVADLFRALLAPGPDRGADVVHGADAGAAQL